MNARMQGPRAYVLFLASTLVCAFGWAKETVDAGDLSVLGSQSLEMLDSAYRQPTPEFVCGCNAIMQYPKEFRRRPQASHPKLGMQWLRQAAVGGSGGANFALAQLIAPTEVAVTSEQRIAYLRAANEAGHTGAALALAQGLLSQPVVKQSALGEVRRLLDMSEASWDKERWLLVAAHHAWAAGQREQAAQHLATARQYLTEIGHPLAEVEALAQTLSANPPAI